MSTRLHRWFAAWFYIFDYTVLILTYEIFYIDTATWWYDRKFNFGMHYPMRFGQRLRFWCCDFLLIIEELVLISTLGWINTSILSTNFLNWSIFLI